LAELPIADCGLIGEEAVLGEEVEEAEGGEAGAGLPEELAAGAVAEGVVGGVHRSTFRITGILPVLVLFVSHGLEARDTGNTGS
jgi:hypothetical protein